VDPQAGNVAPPPELDGTRLVAIMRRTDPGLACETVEALLAAGVRAVEVTLNSPGALDMLRAINDAFGSRALVGAGTVLDVQSAEAALDAGARFIVSPHTDAVLVASLARRGVPCIPGALSPTEILTAWRAGASLVKLFPAGAVGVGFLKDLRGPLSDIPLLPTGGVSLDNAAAFMSAGAWGLGLGSALVDPKLVSARQFDELASRAQAFLHLTAGQTADYCVPGGTGVRP
jgi:2-dehydro-3-deoxyphosphogluconate aldolase / (4S)-4-hydroxy-2-oxoglutarate aldolase